VVGATPHDQVSGVARSKRAVRKRRGQAALATAVCATACGVGAGAALANTPDYFTGLSTNGTPAALDDPTNYNLGVVPTVANDAVIDSTNYNVASATLTLGTNQTFGSLNVTNTLGANTPYAITIQDVNSTATLTLGGGTSPVDSVAGSNPADLLYVDAGSTLTVNNVSGGLITLALAQTGNFDVAGTATINTAISGAGGINKTGAGTLTLAGTSTYTGGTNVSAGVLQIATTFFLGSQGANIGSGVLRFTNPSFLSTGRLFNISSASSTIDASAGGLEFDSTTTNIVGPGTLNLNALGTDSGEIEMYNVSNGYTGGTVLNRGILYLYSNSSGKAELGSGNLSIGAATLELQLYSTSSESGFNVSLNSPTSTIDELVSSYTNELTGVITGTGNLNKTGPGTLELAGVNTYTGATNVSAGTLEFTTVNALATTSGITLAQGTTLEYSNATNLVTLSPSLTLTGPGFSTFTQVNATVTDIYGGAITGAGGLNKTGTFTLYLTNPGNTYSGGTNVSAGILRANVANATGSGTVYVLSGATLGGNGSVGAVVVASGGNISAGSSASSTGTLTTIAPVTFNSGSGIVTKINGTTVIPTGGVTPGDSSGTTPGAINDTLILSGLSTASSTTPGSITVTPSILNAPLVVGTSYSLVIGDIPAANLSSGVPETFSAIVGSLTISNPFYYANASFQDVPSGDAAGDDLLVLDFTAAPEPTSLLLGATAAPLALGRRRRRTGAATTA
jgi:fibronectin-binding autotransporter adhesin